MGSAYRLLKEPGEERGGRTMEKRQFGKTDMQVSVLGFGSAEIGFERASVADVGRLLRSALDAGLNVIDTAECYLASEELIGEAVSGRRDEYYLFTKCGHPDKPGVGDWRPESLLGTITRSLTRLNTDRVDLIHLHSCSEDELRKGDVIAALQKGARKGTRGISATAATDEPPDTRSLAVLSIRSRRRSTSRTRRRWK